MLLAILLTVVYLGIIISTNVDFLLTVSAAAGASTLAVFVLVNIAGAAVLRIRHKRVKLIAKPKKIFKHSGRPWILSSVMFIIGVTVLLLDISAIVSRKGSGVWEIVSIVLLSFCAFEWIYHAFVKVPKRKFGIKRKNIKSMKGIDFENYCAKILTRNGYKKVSVTPPSGDYGADIVAFDKYGNKWVVQCKRYNAKVGNKAVQEVIGAKAYYGANRAMVMTNSVLTDNAKKLAQVNKVKLWEMIH